MILFFKNIFWHWLCHMLQSVLWVQSFEPRTCVDDENQIWGHARVFSGATLQPRGKKTSFAKELVVIPGGSAKISWFPISGGLAGLTGFTWWLGILFFHLTRWCFLIFSLQMSLFWGRLFNTVSPRYFAINASRVRDPKERDPQKMED